MRSLSRLASKAGAASAGARRRIVQDVAVLPRFLSSWRSIAGTPILSTESGTRVHWLQEPAGITNPSIVRTAGGLFVVARTVPYRLSRLHRRGVPIPGGAEEETILCRMQDSRQPRTTSSWTVSAPHSVSGRGYEDPRVFQWNEELWLLWTASSPLDGGRHRNSMVMGRLVGSTVESVVELPSPQGRTREKNWMPLVRGGRLYFVYDLAAGEIYEYRGADGLVRIDSEPHPELAGESGSSQFIAHEGGWIGVSHHRLDRPSLFAWLPVAYYRHRMIQLNHDFSLRSVSVPFFLTERNIEFCAGVVHDEGGLMLSFGVEDSRAGVIHLPAELVQELLPARAERVSA